MVTRPQRAIWGARRSSAPALAFGAIVTACSTGRAFIQRMRNTRSRTLTLRGRSQLTAFFTSATILASSAALKSLTANSTGHTLPSSSFAASLKPSVAYLVLNFCALWKKQTTFHLLPLLCHTGRVPPVTIMTGSGDKM